MLRTPLFWVGSLVALLGGFLYYPLFFPSTDRTLELQSQQFFFEANEVVGAPVLFLSLWLFYRRSHYRDLLRGPGARTIGWAILSLAAALYAWGVYTKALDLQLASLIVLGTGVVLLFGGREGLRAYWLPIVFLGFALPISPVLLAATIYPMQLMTAEFSGWMLNAMGFVSVVQGDQILRPENTFIVIETCSGVRTMLTLAMLTILLIDLFERRGWHAAVLIGLSPLVAFWANGLRVVTLVLNPASSIHAIHNLQGIAMLLVGLTALYLIDGGLERLFGGRRADAEGADYGLLRGDGLSPRRRMAELWAIAGILSAMIAFGRFGPTWSGVRRSLEERPAELLSRLFGEDPRSPYPIDYNFVGSVHDLDHARHRVLVEGGSVEVFLSVADEQQRGTSILTKRLAWPGSGYAPLEETFVEIFEDGPKARRMLLGRGAQRFLSYSWVERRGPLPVEWFRLAAALDRSPFVRPAHMLGLRLATPVGGGRAMIEEAEGRIRAVWRRLAPELAGYAELERSHD